MKDPQNLRSGFTTGTCVATCARVGYQLLGEHSAGNSESRSPSSSESVLFPDGEYRAVVVESMHIKNNSAEVLVIKDAGDDPDVTNKAHISTTVVVDNDYCEDERDHKIVIGKATVWLTVVEGVGEVTREGLDVPVGKWAINPGPVGMIIDNLKDVGCGEHEETVVVSIRVKDGETIGKKTLNATLGVIGGISILGTSGIVVPYSNEAYRDSVKIHLRYASIKQQNTVCICTGGRTKQALERDFDELPDYTFIRIGDFIADTLKFAADFQFDKVVIGCMPGKLFKYSLGLEYTHAHSVKLKTQEMQPALSAVGASEELQAQCAGCPTVREAISLLTEEQRCKLFDVLGAQALAHFTRWTAEHPGLTCEIRCYNFDTTLIGSWQT